MPGNPRWPFFSSRRTVRDAIDAIARWDGNLQRENIKVLQVTVSEVALLIGWDLGTIEISAQGELRFMGSLPRREVSRGPHGVLIEMAPTFVTEGHIGATLPVSREPLVESVMLGGASAMEIFIPLTAQEATNTNVITMFCCWSDAFGCC